MLPRAFVFSLLFHGIVVLLVFTVPPRLLPDSLDLRTVAVVSFAVPDESDGEQATSSLVPPSELLEEDLTELAEPLPESVDVADQEPDPIEAEPLETEAPTEVAVEEPSTPQETEAEPLELAEPLPEVEPEPAAPEIQPSPEPEIAAAEPEVSAPEPIAETPPETLDLAPPALESEPEIQLAEAEVSEPEPLPEPASDALETAEPAPEAEPLEQVAEASPSLPEPAPAPEPLVQEQPSEPQLAEASPPAELPVELRSDLASDLAELPEPSLPEPSLPEPDLQVAEAPRPEATPPPEKPSRDVALPEVPQVSPPRQNRQTAAVAPQEPQDLRPPSVSGVTLDGPPQLVKIIQEQVAPCWRSSPVRGPGAPTVTLRVSLNRNGTISNAVISGGQRMTSDSEFRAMAKGAQAAFMRCGPYRLPREQFALWRELKVEFYAN